MVLLGSDYKKMKKGDAAPDFTLMGVDGAFHALNDIKGSKATLIIFMCNHCPYVIPKMDEIKRIAHDFKNELAVIGINSNEDENYPEDSYEKMQEYFDNWGIDFHYLRDDSQEVAQDYGAVCTPDPFLFDSSLKLVFHSRIDDSHGKKECNRHEMYEVIEKFLSNGQIILEESPSMGCSIKWR